MNRALITGITGQDGSYLAEFLLNKGYQVYGLVRRTSSFSRKRIENLYHYNGKNDENCFKLLYGDLIDSSNLNRILDKVEPHEIYNLAAQSHVGISFEVPEYTADVDALGTLRLLDAIKDTKIKTKFYQASTSELFGKAAEFPQKETTPFYPRSPYAVSKLYAFWITKNYREAFNMFACNGILFNHESPRRGENFVTRKITLSLAKIIKGKQDILYLGNLDAKRDWGYAPDFTYAMWLMLQQEKPDDFVISTGEAHSVKEFVEEACKYCDINLAWKGKGVEEEGINLKTNRPIVKVNPKYYRPVEVDYLIGDYSKAKHELGWEPKVKFKELVEIMMNADLKGV